MSISKVYMICNAYESGVGHGRYDDEAYDIGKERKRRLEKCLVLIQKKTLQIKCLKI